MRHSNSSIKAYEQCPFKFKLTRIDKLGEPSGDAAERGKEIHAEFETAIVGLPILDPQFTYWLDYIDVLRSKLAQAEHKFAVTRDWQTCDFDDDAAWLRGIYDAMYFENDTAHVLDWKTGKERDYMDQLKLYATVIMASHPNVNRVSMEVCYIDLQKRSSYGIVLREQLDGLKKWVTDRIAKIEADTVFAPKPDYGCKWCHFRKGNGGPCVW